ncbi:uncharacterized protein [Oscarella lobularis]|uniref:uncharacterized protein isoform X2 n=1 Tax=Oscarella lobularis TaxID=121494 RepID=UPI003313A273
MQQARLVIARSYRAFATASRSVRIGCASGFWGDTSVAANQLVAKGKLDFLVFDYLSEITMSLLAAARRKNDAAGFCPDFVSDVIQPLIVDMKKNGVRVVSNAGGINPYSCAEAVKSVAAKSGVDVKVAVVDGDNLMHLESQLRSAGTVAFDSGKGFPSHIQSMNAYLGARPISLALDLGADIVITGRCVDSAVVLGPLIHKFGWMPQQYNLLAGGSLAGHLVECGAQATGGIFTDWHKVSSWDNIGFPIVECESDGSFVLTKPPNTGGLVSFGTVAEQLVYEIGDPSAYLLPDVSCDFTQVQISEVAGQEGSAVHVTGAKGSRPSNHYKVSGTYADGFRLTAAFMVTGPKAAEKGRKTADSILKRVKGLFQEKGMKDFSRTYVQIVGTEESYGKNAREFPAESPREVVVWMSVHHYQREALQLFAKEIAPSGTGMAPGLFGMMGGRPKPSPVFKLFSFLHPKNDIQAEVELNGKKHSVDEFHSKSDSIAPTSTQKDFSSGTSAVNLKGDFRVSDLAFLRSGDKGDTANIGVVARKPEYYPLLQNSLTAEAVRKYFEHLLTEDSEVIRYELPGICGLNFVLTSSLGGGGIASLRPDAQGKAYGQMLADYRLQ